MPTSQATLQTRSSGRAIGLGDRFRIQVKPYKGAKRERTGEVFELRGDTALMEVRVPNAARRDDLPYTVARKTAGLGGRRGF